MKKMSYLLPLLSVLVLVGCAGSQYKVEKPSPLPLVVTQNVVPYDSIVDMGQYAEAWIAPYKDKDDNLYNSRSMNFWVKKPDFIIGEDLPDNNTEGVEANSTHQPFNLKMKEQEVKKELTEEPKKEVTKEEKISLNDDVANFLKQEEK